MVGFQIIVLLFCFSTLAEIFYAYDIYPPKTEIGLDKVNFFLFLQVLMQSFGFFLN